MAEATIPVSGDRKALGRLLGYLDHPSRTGLAGFSLVAVQSIENVWIAFALKETLDALLSGVKKQFGFWIAALLVAEVFLSLIHLIATGLRFRSVEQVARNLRLAFCESVLWMPLLSSENLPRGDLSSRLTADVAACSQVPTELYLISRRVLSAILAAGYMLYLNWQVAVVAALTGPLVLGVSGLLSRPIGQKSHGFQEKVGDGATWAINSLEGRTVVKSFSAEGWAESQFRAKTGDIRNAGVNLGKAVALTKAWSGVGPFLPYLAVFGFGGYMAVHGRLTVGGMIALVQLCNNLAWPLSEVSGQVAEMKRSLGAFRRVVEIIDREKEDLEPGDDRAPLVPDACPDLQVADLSFEYASGAATLSDISFDAAPGSLVVVAGRSGCGKSTLLKILAGLYTPGSGTVKVWGHDLHYYGPAWARSFAAYVPQEPFLLSGSIRENLQLAKSSADDHELRAAVAQADAAGFVFESAAGLDRDAGERGGGFSGGERQRLAIARTLLKDGRLLLVDEPTSSLDKESEERVWSSLKRALKDRTCIAATHRLDVAKEADLVLVMDGGRIVERGTHEELLANKSLYRQLFNGREEAAV